MKIYTRSGDGGETDLIGGPRVAKDHLRVEAYGAVDELNASLGVCAATTRQADLRGILQRVQELLFTLGSYLATAVTQSPSDDAGEAVLQPRADDVDALEQKIDLLEQELAPLEHFILPGGCEVAAAFHVARATCRRAERLAVRLHRDEPLGEASLRYLNRLSDLLFVMARVENRRAGFPETEWQGRRSRPRSEPQASGGGPLQGKGGASRPRSEPQASGGRAPARRGRRQSRPRSEAKPKRPLSFPL